MFRLPGAALAVTLALLEQVGEARELAREVRVVHLHDVIAELGERRAAPVASDEPGAAVLAVEHDRDGCRVETAFAAGIAKRLPAAAAIVDAELLEQPCAQRLLDHEVADGRIGDRHETTSVPFIPACSWPGIEE